MYVAYQNNQYISRIYVKHVSANDDIIKLYEYHLGEVVPDAKIPSKIEGSDNIIENRDFWQRSILYYLFHDNNCEKNIINMLK